jgi:hypothetical protein
MIPTTPVDLNLPPGHQMEDFCFQNLENDSDNNSRTFEQWAASFAEAPLQCPMCNTPFPRISKDTDLKEPLKDPNYVRIMRKHYMNWHPCIPIWNACPRFDLAAYACPKDDLEASWPKKHCKSARTLQARAQ